MNVIVGSWQEVGQRFYRARDYVGLLLCFPYDSDILQVRCSWRYIVTRNMFTCMDLFVVRTNKLHTCFIDDFIHLYWA